MIRNIFIGTFKAEITEDVRRKYLLDMKAMKEKIPGIVTLEAGFSASWTGNENQIIVTADAVTEKDFNDYMTHTYHKEYIAKAAEEYLEPSSFVVTQFEF